MDFTLRLDVTPKGKATPLPIVIGKRVRTASGATAVLNPWAKATKDPATRAREAEIVALVLSASPAGLPPVAAYALDILAVLPAPKGLRTRNGVAVWAPVKPDADNVVKSAQDAITVAMRHVLGDDAHCVMVRVGKLRRPGEAPSLTIRVYDAPEALPDWLTSLHATPCVAADAWRNLDTPDDIGGPA